jgi:hypothetical protein
MARRMADVFVSYSRQRDTEFVDALSAVLEAQGQSVWVDREDILPSSAWRPEIERAIRESHNVLFVIGPESIASQYCRTEFDHAIALNKRIVPLLAHEILVESHRYFGSRFHPGGLIAQQARRARNRR